MSATRLDKDSLRLLRAALDRLDAGFTTLPPLDTTPDDAAAMERVLLDVAERLHDNYPYFHPLYAGQMLKPPHPVARLAYALAQWINPNNHALDGGRASSAMEKEAVAELARLFGWDAHLGHLCGGGTMANLEALWVAGRLHPGKVVLASEQAHYTHQRIGGVLGLAVEVVACDRRGRMDPDALAQRLARGDVGIVVATLGTTAIGSVDPLPRILELQARHGFRVHVSAASTHARAIFDAAARRHVHLALSDLPVAFFDLEHAGIRPDRERITCLRSVLMKPEHEAWLERIWSRLDDATTEVLA